jgi:hypothetical protein
VNKCKLLEGFRELYIALALFSHYVLVSNGIIRDDVGSPAEMELKELT